MTDLVALVALVVLGGLARNSLRARSPLRPLPCELHSVPVGTSENASVVQSMDGLFAGSVVFECL